MNPPRTKKTESPIGPLVTHDTEDYLAARLDGARGLYLLALALGKRCDHNAHEFGRMIREARIHFSAVIEEARLAGLDTGSIAVVLSDASVSDTLRPNVRAWLDQLMSPHA